MTEEKKRARERERERKYRDRKEKCEKENGHYSSDAMKNVRYH